MGRRPEPEPQPSPQPYPRNPSPGPSPHPSPNPGLLTSTPHGQAKAAERTSSPLYLPYISPISPQAKAAERLRIEFRVPDRWHHRSTSIYMANCYLHLGS